MRGALRYELWALDQWGIIPADAGSTRDRSEYWFKFWDHPRGCGEHRSSILPETMQSGSSPRMRGAPEKTLIVAVIRGIIPADAGSTVHRIHRHGRTKDHPRGCGEHDTVLLGEEGTEGSSPRMRGAQAGSSHPDSHGRIIPADAGST